MVVYVQFFIQQDNAQREVAHLGIRLYGMVLHDTAWKAAREAKGSQLSAACARQQPARVCKALKPIASPKR